MEFSIYYKNMFDYVLGNTLLTIALIAFIAFLIWRKPKFFFGMAILTVLLLGIFYLIDHLSDTGSSNKQKLVQEKKLPFFNEPK